MMVRMRILRFRSDGSSLRCIFRGGAIVDLAEKLPPLRAKAPKCLFPRADRCTIGIVETLDFLAHDGLLLRLQGI